MNEQQEILALADEYEAGLIKCVASGYEEFSAHFVRRQRLVIDALRNCAGMPWERANTAIIDTNAFYVVQHNGHEWRDFDLMIMHGLMVQSRLKPDYVRGRPEWIAKIDRPAPERKP